jgi:hypothetical protein
LVLQFWALVFLVGLTAFTANKFVRALSEPLSKAVSAGQQPTSMADEYLKLPEFQPQSASDFPQTLARPIFFEGRTFPLPPAAPMPLPQVPVGASIEGLRLLGIRIEGGARKALIGVKGQPPVWLDEGAQLESWTVQKIEDSSVSLVAAGQTANLQLYAPRTMH